ncbi:MAG: T9SS type A sorting domain-containing protein [Bacteroidales bacterium]|nr:T9SS type A sorting domain-containing protein [Bacteroidales bacterium]
MKRLISLSVMLTILSVSAFAQVSVASVKTKKTADLVQDYLIGPNIVLVNDSAHKSTFQLQETVTSNQLGVFTNKIKNSCDMPMDTGLVITTCPIEKAKPNGSGDGYSCSPKFNVSNMPDSVFYWTYTKYCIENNMTIMSVNNVGYLSFWIKPVIDNFQFSYCFASDEYPTYVEYDYNDFFGFFFSGPYDEYGNYVEGSAAYTMQNLALIPGTQTPVMINTVHSGGGKSNGPKNQQYHIAPTGSCKQSCGFSQWTKKLPTATTVVIADAYYKIDIAVCNISDEALQSGLFISKDMRRFDTVNIDTTICENVDYYIPGFDEPLTQAGSYQYIFENITGGDSLINVTLHVNPTVLENHCWKLKSGDNFDFDYMNIAAPGTYSITYSTWLGCDSTVVYNVEWGNETMEVECVGSGLNETTKDLLKIYPNPAKDVLFVEGAEYNSDVMIFDTYGRVVKEEKLTSNSIDISSLTTGTYIINITTGNNSVSRKLNIQK